MLVWFLRMEWTTPAAGAKVIASFGFLATAISVAALQHSFGRMIFIGLVLSMLGDIALIDPSRERFLLGLGSFLLAHLAYITAFVSYGVRVRWAAFAAIPVLFAVYFVVLWLQPGLPADVAAPVYAYIAVISLMVVCAFGARGAGAPGLIVAGALLFFVSDLSVAAQRILEVDFPTIVWGLPLYYAAQLCIAVGASHSSSH